MTERQNKVDISPHGPKYYDGEHFDRFYDELEPLPASDIANGLIVNAVLRTLKPEDDITIYHAKVVRLTSPNDLEEMRTLVLYRTIKYVDTHLRQITPYVGSMTEQGGIYSPGVELQKPEVLAKERLLGFLTLKNI